MNDQDLAELTAEREQIALQALMEISSAGFTEQAEILARECGLLSLWKSPVKVIQQQVWP